MFKRKLKIGIIVAMVAGCAASFTSSAEAQPYGYGRYHQAKRAWVRRQEMGYARHRMQVHEMKAYQHHLRMQRRYHRYY